MLKWFLIMPIAALFMVINFIAGCYVMIRLGYGPPNWQTALNQVVRVTTFQNQLNKARDWLDKRAPWADSFLYRLNVPKPIIIVDTTPEEEEEEEGEEYSEDEVLDESAGEHAPGEEPAETPPLETELSVTGVPEQ